MSGATKVLYCENNVDGTIGGSYFSLLYLVKGLDRKRFEPIVVFYTDHALLPAFRDAGIETHIWSRPTPFTFGLDGRGAWRVLRLGAERGDPPRGVTALRAGSEDETLDQLRTLISRKPGFAAVDFSGRPEVVDRLLEVLPRWGRLMVAGRPTERFTIDFYNNVHRKGAEVLCDVFDPSHALGRPQDRTVQSYFDQAYRILQNPNMAAVCRSVTPCLS